MKRREFLAAAGTMAIGSVLSKGPAWASELTGRKKKLAVVGTGVRGIGFWGKNLVENYGDQLEFVGLCDPNPGRVQFAKEYMGVSCPTFTNFDEMMQSTRPDCVVVTTPDAFHHQYIIQSLEYGSDVITEKPLTTDEDKCRAILAAEKKTGRKVTVGFNYRYGLHFTRLKEVLQEDRSGTITSVDFHWYLNTSHGASYFRRWHGLRQFSGTLLVHKATHHFDLLNWWLDSDPVEVHAFGALEHYGKNHTFRHTNCRGCPHIPKCPYFWDITQNEKDMQLYVANEKHDGYIRDACLWRNEIDIFDKMAVQIRYANNVQVSYSLTTYSPFEGWHIAFNGFNGRVESWEDIPWHSKVEVDQAELHKMEMSQNQQEKPTEFNEIIRMENFHKYERILVPILRSGHGGGDKRLHDRIFVDPLAPDPLNHAAGTRDGAMSVLIGIAARKSIDEKRVVKISELTDIEPMAKRPKAYPDFYPNMRFGIDALAIPS